MAISKHYNPSETEGKWYSYWWESGYFHSEPDDRETYTVLMPPPNVTGVLHMGHMLNNTIQDVLIRRARLKGYNACWVPGTDHASIATEAKVVKWLKEEKGLKKHEISREEFMDYAMQWKDKYGGIILDQLKKLGASCDWEREAFTMDESRSEAVIHAFVDLYRKGKLYRDYRIVHWDPEAQTVLSNEEVLHTEENGSLYYIKYYLKGSDDYLTIATTRPETIMADTAVAVHPADPRYKNYVGKQVKVPLTDRSVEVISDEYVDREFGTGALKITPAHDPNDYMIGKKHELEVIEIFDDRAILNEKAGKEFDGLDRDEARKKAVEILKSEDLLLKVEDYTHSVGRSERTNAVVEPKLSLQWYVDMEDIAQPALKAVMEDFIHFFPEKQKNTYRHWMENIRDWCISRQLWWGHRIPVWYYQGKEFVAESAEEALDQARAQFQNVSLTLDDLQQDEDVLDTWFSSWLWPISVFDGFKADSDIAAYYPTNVLVTGWDIIFLWVARMIMAGYEWRDQMPFNDVYFTGMVRDKQRRKMSKSLGNSPDALKLIDQYGADAVRYGLLSFSPAGGDLLYDVQLVEQGRNFANKIWNAFRLVKSFDVEVDAETPVARGLAVNWISDSLNALLEDIEEEYDKYRLSQVAKKLYSFIWSEFCSWYLEMIKPEYGEKLDSWTYNRTVEVFEKLMILLHPYMPFITEEIYHGLKEREEGDDCIIATYPEVEDYDAEFIKTLNTLKTLVSNIREQRNSKGISPKEKLGLSILESSIAMDLYAPEGRMEFIKDMAHISEITWVKEVPNNSIPFVSGTEKYFLEVGDVIDVSAEKERIEKELEHARGFLISVQKKLGNEKFVENAPEQVVARERQKLEDGRKRLSRLEETLENLN